ncbi:MAG: VOC family protein [Candidatus Omnitrophica bacterium]|nr:VOC family protein [Candidatus Omnitrophota bacterium]
MVKLNFFGKDARFHHVGIVVKSIKEVCPSSRITIDPIQGVSVAFVSLNGVKLELIEPYSDNSPVTGSLKKGIKLLHICYAVSNIENIIKECRKFGFHCIAQPVPAAAFNKKIAWVYSNEYGLFELLEKKDSKKK